MIIRLLIPNNSNDYISQKSILGDVINIFNLHTGAYIGGYIYDAWGKLLYRAYTDVANALDIVAANPFRYRGYYYDTETKLYYLNSRYYDPETSRFISADNPVNLFLTADTVFGANLYAYCADNPVKYMMITEGDLLICEGGDAGRSAIWNYDYPIRFQNHIHN